jgi:hypothetical protein
MKHDSMRKCSKSLLDIAPQSYFILDEAHMCLNDSQRTAVSLDMTDYARGCIKKTGTPLVDTKLSKLANTLQRNVRYECNIDNFFVCASSMTARDMKLDLLKHEKEVEVQITSENKNSERYKRYKKTLPVQFGGLNTHSDASTFWELYEMDLEFCEDEMLKFVSKKARSTSGVQLCARSQKHAEEMRERLIHEYKFRPYEIFCLGKDRTMNFRTGDESLVKIAINPITMSTGYDWGKFQIYVSGVYPSSLADRIQSVGRIAGLRQQEPEIFIYTFHRGMHTKMLRGHNEAKSLYDVCTELVDKFETHDFT